MTVSVPCSCGLSKMAPPAMCDDSCQREAENRSAIVDHRDKIAALARPQQLHSTDIREEVAVAKETEDLFRVYVDEWVVKYVSNSPGSQGLSEAQAHFNARYEGRVRTTDVQYQETIGDLCALHLRLPNMKGEFKDRSQAENYILRLQEVCDGSSARIVVRSSRNEHQLREYSVKKLPKGEIS